jgi:hypothetical protein
VVFASIESSDFNGNNRGIVLNGPAGFSQVRVMVNGSLVANNSDAGFFVFGATASGRVGDTTITNNGTGLFVNTGTLSSYGDNRLNGNVSEGAFSPPTVTKS